MENKTKDGKQVSESGMFASMKRKAEEYLKQPLRVNDLLNDAYKKASEKKDIGSIAGEVWESMTTLFRMIKASVSGQYEGLPTATIIGGIAVIIYFLTPIDFIPDFIPVLGLLDDVSLAAWFMTSIAHELERYNEWEMSGASADKKSGSAKNKNAESDNRHTTDTSFGKAKYEKENHVETNSNTTMKENKENKGWESKTEDKKASLKVGNEPLDDTYHDSDYRHVSDKNKHNNSSDNKNQNSGSGKA